MEQQEEPHRKPPHPGCARQRTYCAASARLARKLKAVILLPQRWPRHDTIGSLTAARRLRHEFTPRPARSTNRPRLRISVRDAARELHDRPRAVLQWAEPRDAALLRRSIAWASPARQPGCAARSTCFRHSGSAAAKRARLTAAHLSGDLDRIQRAEMRSERNRLRALWRRDPREPGRTIMLVPADEATCRAWAARQGFQLDVSTATFRRSPMRAGGYGRGCRAV